MFSLIIPTYNERESIVPLFQRVYSTLERTQECFEIIVVDDDSPDRTWEVAQELAMEVPHLRVIRRLEQKGLATAVVAGWAAARGDILGVIDGDLQHPPEALEKLLMTILTGSADVVIASRHVQGGGVSDWNLFRRVISWGATCLATLAIPGTLKRVRDPMSGYFLLRRSVIESVHLAPTGYKILLEVLAKGTYRSVREVPYVFQERKEGSSKLGPRQQIEYIFHLGRLAKETGELHRFLCFCTVGLSGIVVNEAALWLLTSLAGLGYIYSSIIAVEIAIMTNFLLNNFWTFRDKTNLSPDFVGCLRRFFKFNLICAFGGVLNTITLWGLTELLGIYYLISNLFGTGISTIWNYGLNANVTWQMQIAPQLNVTDPSLSINNKFVTRDLEEKEKRPL